MNRETTVAQVRAALGPDVTYLGHRRPVVAASTSPNILKVTLPFTSKPIRVVPGVATTQWWNGVASKRWEMETFRAFNQEIAAGGTYIGFGEWVGVTGLFAASRVSRAVLMDADPQAFEELVINVEQNVDLLVSDVYVDSRCISNKVGTVTMRANGGSGSSIVGTEWSKSFPTVVVNCTTLPLLVSEYNIEAALGEAFIKIDTEGAESVILPSLLPWLRSVTTLPTLFVSMHDTANSAQRGDIATVLNQYPYYAIVPGRTKESLSGPGVDDGRCSSGITVVPNDNGTRFTPETICRWCDYLLVSNPTRSIQQCGPHNM